VGRTAQPERAQPGLAAQLVPREVDVIATNGGEPSAARRKKRPRRRDSNDQAQDMFQRAIDLDPSYADAYAELGLSLIEAVSSGWSDFVADDLGRAETLAQKALSLDPASTRGYRLLAEVDLARGRFQLALAQIDRALTLNPGDADALGERGAILVLAGRAEEALPWIERGSASIPAVHQDRRSISA
jgi:adenylate cyclase